MLREPEIFHVLDFLFLHIFRIVFFLYLVNLVDHLVGLSPVSSLVIKSSAGWGGIA